MTHIRFIVAYAFLTLGSATGSLAQIASWDEGTTGVVTTVEQGAITELDYAAKGILADWNETLEDYEEHKTELNELEEEINTLVKKDHRGRISPFHARNGMTFNLPFIPGENGENLYLLTREGITFYMTIDAPVYLQEPDDEIVRWIRYYAHTAKERTRRMFARYEGWEPRIKDYFESQGVPTELAELCLVESGCTYEALSPAGALGMWQFMPETGRSMGLMINGAVDERKDPVKSTTAAAKYLIRCYQKTGDWTLAAASYNCGTGHFTKQGRKGLMWDQVKRYLPKETQQYIPCLIAIHYVWTYRFELGV